MVVRVGFEPTLSFDIEYESTAKPLGYRTIYFKFGQSSSLHSKYSGIKGTNPHG